MATAPPANQGEYPPHEHACDGGDRDKYVPNSKPYIRRPRPIADADPVFTVTHGCRTVLPVELMALAGDGRVRMLTQTYPLDAANDAMDDLDSGRLRGRGILTPTTR